MISNDIAVLQVEKQDTTFSPRIKLIPNHDYIPPDHLRTAVVCVAVVCFFVEVVCFFVDVVCFMVKVVCFFVDVVEVCFFVDDLLKLCVEDE